jgi:hypothetical protein
MNLCAYWKSAAPSCGVWDQPPAPPTPTTTTPTPTPTTTPTPNYVRVLRLAESPNLQIFILSTSYLLHTAYLLPPASYLIPPTSNLLHLTSYLLHPTSSGPLAAASFGLALDFLGAADMSVRACAGQGSGIYSSCAWWARQTNINETKYTPT